MTKQKGLEQEIKELGFTIEEAMRVLKLFKETPAVDFYEGIVNANKELLKRLKDKSIDLDDPYDRAVLEILKTGEKIPKMFSLAKLEAYPDMAEAIKKDEEMVTSPGSLLDSVTDSNNREN